MKKKADHVTIGENSLRCLNCGDEFQMPLPVSINMFVAMGNGFTADHADCKPTEKAAAKTNAKDIHAWFHSWDTGMSSKTIWHFFMPGIHHRPDYYPAIPHDPADFGRCHRLLKLAPEWRARLDEMGAKLPTWKPFTDAWAQMEVLWDDETKPPSKTAPKLYALMQQCAERSGTLR